MAKKREREVSNAPNHKPIITRTIAKHIRRSQIKSSWTDERADCDGLADKRVGGQKRGRTDGRTSERAYGRADGRDDGQTHGRAYGRKGGRMVST